MKILLLRLGAIGDIVQIAIAIALFKIENPETKIDWVVDKSLKEFVSAFGVADCVISLDYKSLIEGSLFSRILKLIAAVIKLSSLGSYYKAINGHKDFRYSLLLSFVSTKKINKLDRPYPIIHRFKIYENYRLLSNEEKNLLKIEDGVKYIRENLRKININKNYLTEKNYVLIAPGGAKNLLSDDPLRRWPIENYILLSKKIREYGMQVVIVGGETDEWVNEYIKDLDVINLIGKTSLLGLFNLIDNTKLIVSHDSGILHIAQLTESPIVAMFGPTPANALISFSREKTKILHKQNTIECSPCYNGKTYAPCKDNKCMKEITVEDVFDKVLKLLN